MSDEDEEISEGFSASEDDWKPDNTKGGESSDDDDSDFEEKSPVVNNPRSGRGSRNSQRKGGVSSGAVSKKKKPSGQSLRSKLYNKYRPPPKTVSNSPSASTSRSASKNAHKPDESRDDGNDSSSDSSVDNYLVDPKQLDINSTFFDISSSKDQSSEQAPVFDCNAGLKNLSDSGSEDDNESSNEERKGEAMKTSFDFQSLLENANKFEKAKEAMAKKAAAEKKSKGANLAETQTLDALTLLALGENLNAKNAPGNGQPNELGPSKLTKTKSTRIKRHTKTRPTSAIIKSGKADGSESDEDEFEEVADYDADVVEKAYKTGEDREPGGNLEIIVDLPNRKKSKKDKLQEDIENALKRRLNHEIKKKQLLMHKTSFLCLFARTYNYNSLFNDPLLMQNALKLLPSPNAYPPEKGTEIKYFQSFVTWFKTAIKITNNIQYVVKNIPRKKKNLVTYFKEEIIKKEAKCWQDFVFIFVILARAMGFQCRLVANLQPLPMKPNQSDLMTIKMKKEDDKDKDNEEKLDRDEKPGTSAKSQSSGKSSSSKSSSNKKEADSSLEKKESKSRKRPARSQKNEDNDEDDADYKEPKNESFEVEEKYERPKRITRNKKALEVEKDAKENNEPPKRNTRNQKSSEKADEKSLKEENLSREEPRPTSSSRSSKTRAAKNLKEREAENPEKLNPLEENSSKEENPSREEPRPTSSSRSSKTRAAKTLKEKEAENPENLNPSDKSHGESKSSSLLPEEAAETNSSQTKDSKKLNEISAPQPRSTRSKSKTLEKPKENLSLEDKSEQVSSSKSHNNSKSKDKPNLSKLKLSQSLTSSFEGFEASEQSSILQRSQEKPNLSKLKRSIPYQSSDEEIVNKKPTPCFSALANNSLAKQKDFEGFSDSSFLEGFSENEAKNSTFKKDFEKIPKIEIISEPSSSSKPEEAKANDPKTSVKSPRSLRSRSKSPKFKVDPFFLKNKKGLKPEKNETEDNFEKEEKVFLADRCLRPRSVSPKPLKKDPDNKENKPLRQSKRNKMEKDINSNLPAPRTRSRRNSPHSNLVIPQLDGADDLPLKGKSSKKPQLKKLNKTRSKETENSEEEFEPSPAKKPKAAPILPKQVQQIRKDRRVLSTDNEDDLKGKKDALDFWVEVWSDVEMQWIPIDLMKGKVNSIESIRKTTSSNLSYIFAFQNDLSIKDVTARYCPHWSTTIRKNRIDKEWLNAVIEPRLGVRTERDIREDAELRRIHEEKPMPTSIAEFKDHPLYVLQRHLLKFQALYPAEIPSLGFIRGEPIYPRECVYTLHSREIWLKSARVVKLGEKPYKIVKARPKWDRMTQSVIKDQPLEIFGIWQTEDYDPPTAENGIVPRNAYGNVELFKECMLPKKTVHLRLPGLQRICKKLNIDCANAVVGFDFHQGACHPTYDGFVVCEEFKDTVIDAWNEDQAEQTRKEQEKYEARVYGNWKKLIRGLLIRERLKKKYNF